MFRWCSGYKLATILTVKKQLKDPQNMIIWSIGVYNKLYWSWIWWTASKRHLGDEIRFIRKYISYNSLQKEQYFYPPLRAEGYRFGVVCPAVRPHVRPFVTNLLGLYLKDYYRFEHETSGVYRSHWGEVHCTRNITLHCLILEWLPFVIFYTWILCGTYLSDCKRYQHETLYR